MFWNGCAQNRIHAHSGPCFFFFFWYFYLYFPLKIHTYSTVPLHCTYIPQPKKKRKQNHATTFKYHSRPRTPIWTSLLTCCWLMFWQLVLRGYFRYAYMTHDYSRTHRRLNLWKGVASTIRCVNLFLVILFWHFLSSKTKAKLVIIL